MNIHAYEEIVIGGISTKVLQIMLFTSQWVSKNYYYPLNRLTQRISYPPILPPNPPPIFPHILLFIIIHNQIIIILIQIMMMNCIVALYFR